MRHFVGLSASVATLASSVGVASTKAGLVALACGLYAASPNLRGARLAAVAVAAVAVAANDHGCATASAQVPSWVGLHRHKGPTGFGWTRPDVS